MTFRGGDGALKLAKHWLTAIHPHVTGAQIAISALATFRALVVQATDYEAAGLNLISTLYITPITYCRILALSCHNERNVKPENNADSSRVPMQCPQIPVPNPGVIHALNSKLSSAAYSMCL